MPTQKIVYIKMEQKLFSSFASFCKEKIKENGRWLFERCLKYKKILKILVYIKERYKEKHIKADILKTSLMVQEKIGHSCVEPKAKKENHNPLLRCYFKDQIQAIVF